MSKLHNVRGRITYISSHAKQENLYAVYETTDRHYWTELARFNQQEFLKSGTEGKCIEARELIIALPESFPDLYDPDRLLQMFTNRFKEKYGVECVSALHHNKRKTNYHIHLIFSERELLPEPIEKIATRNMFYNEQKKHVRTKKEILNDSGNVRKGCKIIKKGEVYERTLFTAKNKLFKQEHYLDEAKRFYTDLINLLIEDDKEKLHVFDKNGLYLATKKIGKNNPKAKQIKTDNEVRMMWNHEVDRALVSQVPGDEIRQIKKEFITDRIRNSIKVWGNRPELLLNIILTATKALALLTSKVLTAARELKNKLFYEALGKEYGSKAVIKAEDTADVVTAPAKETITEPEPSNVTITATVPETEVVEQPKPQIPPRPVMPPEAAAFPRLQKVKVTLDKQNHLIFEAERERTKLEIKLSDLKGLARLTKKKELESRITTKNEEIRTLKAGLSGIVRQHGFATVQDFYTAFYTAQRATDAYQKECAKWDEAYGEKATPKAETIHEKIRRYQEKADRQNASQPYQSRDNGAR
ncbi:MobA/MobL family protein [Lachnospiraceae bacterium 45-P1]